MILLLCDMPPSMKHRGVTRTRMMRQREQASEARQAFDTSGLESEITNFWRTREDGRGLEDALAQGIG